MNVKDLVRKLQEFDPASEVVVTGITEDGEKEIWSVSEEMGPREKCI